MTAPALAALDRPLPGADGSAQLLPDGEFDDDDGRPASMPGAVAS